ncbi:MAG: GNAT family protein [Sandaracinaceae bacterium]
MFERWAGDPDFTRYLSWPVHRGVEDSRAFIERVIGAWRRRDGHLPWVIEDRMDGPIGSVGVTLDAHRVSLGMGIAPAWQGRGYATEAVRAVVEAALTDPNVHRLWAVCDLDNHASARVLEKSGLEYEGVLRRFSLRPNLSQTPRDSHCYARVR